MYLPAHTRDRIEEIKLRHIPVRMKVPGFWFKKDGCMYCGVLFPCRERQWAMGVESGRIKPAGWWQ